MAKFEITQGQLAEAVVAMAHYVEHLKGIANNPNGRGIDVVLARHHLESAIVAQRGLEAVFATTAEEEFAA
jgi:hypothetical protein